VVVVEHRDRLARFGVENPNVALGAHGWRIVVAESTAKIRQPAMPLTTAPPDWLDEHFGEDGVR
jgi:hypothetical protein